MVVKDNWNKSWLADQANHLTNQLRSDMDVLEDIKGRWGADGRCQVEDLQERFRARPVPDPDHLLYIALSGIGTEQDSLVTEVGQAIDAGEHLAARLKRVIAGLGL